MTARKQRKREQAIAALLTAASIKDAAQAVGISERTLRRWLDDDAGFAADYHAARRRAIEVAIANLQQAAGEAAATLRRNLAAAAPAVQVRAAIAILQEAAKGTELLDLLNRVAALEQHSATMGMP
jgi:transposase